MKSGLWGLTGISMGVALGWMSMRGMPWDELWLSLTEVDWSLFVLALGAMLFAGLLEAYRWKLLLPQERVSVARLFLVRNTGNGVNNISPVRVLAEVTQTVMLRYGNNIGTHKVVSSLIIARLFDLLVTVSLVGAGLVVIPQLSGLRPIALPLWGIISVSIVAFIVLGKRLRQVPVVCRFSSLEAMLHSMSSVVMERRTVLGCMLLTVIAWMSIGVAAWLVAQGAGIDLPFWLMSIVIVAVTLFSGIIPAPPGAVGVYEFGAIYALGLFAVDQSLALTFALVIHVVLFLPPTLIGVAVLMGERHTLSRLVTAVVKTVRPKGSKVETAVR